MRVREVTSGRKLLHLRDLGARLKKRRKREVVGGVFVQNILLALA